MSASTTTTRAGAWPRLGNATQPTAIVTALLEEHQELTRGELSQLSGLSKTTVTNSVRLLLRRGQVVQADRAPSASRSGKGRPPSVLSLTPRAGSVAAVAFSHGYGLGDGPVDVAVGDLSGAVRYRTSRSRSGKDPALVAGSAITEGLQALGVPAPPLRVVLSVPAPVSRGHVDPARAERPVLLPFAADFLGSADPAADLEGLLGAPVSMVNDADLAALAEALVGAGVDASHVAHLTVARGLGLGLAVAGDVHRSGDGVTGELLHLRSAGCDAWCVCGEQGCLAAALTYQVTPGGVVGWGFAELTGVLPPKGSRSPREQARFREAQERLAPAVADVAGLFLGLYRPDVVIVDAALAQVNPVVAEAVCARLRRAGPLTEDGRVVVRVGDLPDAPLRGALLLAARQARAAAR